MIPRSTFEDRLHDLIEDGPTEAPAQLLETVIAAVPSIPQRRGAWRVPWRTSPMIGFARALAGIAIVVGLGSAALFVVMRSNPGGAGGQATTPPVVASPTPIPSAASPASAPTPAASAIGPCDPAHLVARITLWEGAAGHRIADVELTNAGSSPCIVQAILVPQLVDGHGSVLINGTAPAAEDPFLTIAPGAVLKTLVQDGNYCGPTPAAPVSVAFVQADGSRFVATPFSPTDVTVPPCLAGAGSAGDIEMHPWAP
jgi:hypothetical protein